MAALQGTKVIPAAKVAEAIDKAKKPQLKACEGDPTCLAELGRLVGAQIVVSGEVGGLGDSKVIYLGTIDVATAKEMRSTTLTINARPTAGIGTGSGSGSGGHPPVVSDEEGGGASGAALRPLRPDRYPGTVPPAI